MSVSDETAPDAEVVRVAQAIKAAVHDLPFGQEDAAFEQMSAAFLEVQRSGSPAAAVRYVTSLNVTSRLHRNPSYKKALAEADAELQQEMAAAVPVSQLVDQMRARFA